MEDQLFRNLILSGITLLASPSPFHPPPNERATAGRARPQHLGAVGPRRPPTRRAELQGN